MTDMKLMESKAPTWEVVPREAAVMPSKTVSAETYETGSGAWSIRIKDGRREVCLTGTQAQAIAEFIVTHVRKRW